MSAVQIACGTPSSTTTRQIQVSTPVTTTQWIYTLGYVSTQNTTLFLPSLAITFNDQKVSGIDRSGLPISGGGYCNSNGLVNIGDSAGKVLLTCGQPNFVNTHQEAVTTTQNVVEWIYNYGPYKPRILLDFGENENLTQITTGQLGS